jgi:aryl-alcohol dehydrogenase-like predicted oxidoreductase
MVSEQLPYNLLDRRVENEILPACEWAELAVLVWSPLAMGFFQDVTTITMLRVSKQPV